MKAIEMAVAGGFSIYRPLDSLGRIVIPKEIRNMLYWDIGDSIYMGVKDGTVFLRMFTDTCGICGTLFESGEMQIYGKNICSECQQKIKEPK